MIKRLVMGLSCGACLDGVQAALVEVFDQGRELRVMVRRTHAEAFGQEVRQLLHRVAQPRSADTFQAAVAHRVIGEAAAHTARQMADRAGVSLGRVLCAGLLGLAACHESDGAVPTHLSLGAPAIVAERTGLSTIHDFVWRDLAAHGHGAPLAALVDALLFQVPDESRLILHLSGLTQVSLLSAASDPANVRSLECGPGMALLEALMHHLGRHQDRMDAIGHWAVQGKQIPELLERWQQHPMLHKKLPMSLHRQHFSDELAKQTVAQAQQKSWKGEDVLCTAHHWLAWSLRHGLGRLGVHKGPPVHRVILTGRGTRNGFLLRLIEEQFPGIPLDRSEQHGVPGESHQAVSAAVLACLFLDGEAANVPSVTGASGPRLLGSLTPGNRSNWGKCLAWLTGQFDLWDMDQEDD